MELEFAAAVTSAARERRLGMRCPPLDNQCVKLTVRADYLTIDIFANTIFNTDLIIDPAILEDVPVGRTTRYRRKRLDRFIYRNTGEGCHFKGNFGLDERYQVDFIRLAMSDLLSLSSNFTMGFFMFECIVDDSQSPAQNDRCRENRLRVFEELPRELRRHCVRLKASVAILRVTNIGEVKKILRYFDDTLKRVDLRNVKGQIEYHNSIDLPEVRNELFWRNVKIFSTDKLACHGTKDDYKKMNWVDTVVRSLSPRFIEEITKILTTRVDLDFQRFRLVVQDGINIESVSGELKIGEGPAESFWDPTRMGNYREEILENGFIRRVSSSCLLIFHKSNPE